MRVDVFQLAASRTQRGIWRGKSEMREVRRCQIVEMLCRRATLPTDDRVFQLEIEIATSFAGYREVETIHFLTA